MENPTPIADKTTEAQYRQELFDRLKKSLSFRKQEECFESCLEPTFWWLVEKPHPSIEDLTWLIPSGCICNKRSLIKKRAECVVHMREILKKAGQKRAVVRFACPQGLYGFAYPIAQGDKLYGFIGAYFTKRDVSDETLSIFSTFTDAIVREVQKEVELSKLYETIRPRAIALSTVHTVHRLISSTLDMNELLPRIVRLSLQVIRANRCSLKIVDAKRKILLPKATVDLREKKSKMKKVAVGKWAPGKAVKYGRPIRGTDYLAVPLIDEDVIGVITVYDKIDKKPFSDFDQEIMTTLAEQAVIAIKNAQLYKEQEKLTIGSIRSLAAALDTRAPGTYVRRASTLKISLAIGQAMRMDANELKSLEYAVVLHDAGQVTVPTEVLAKPSKLTGKEYKIVKEHPAKGVEIIKHIKALKSVIPFILYHHENYDGSGYPKGLKKDQIPLGARIMAAVSAFEAMITKKPYRPPMTVDQAVTEIKNNSGTQFDPRVVEEFLKVMKRKDIRTLLKREPYEHR